jgi:hypothetical protein
VNHGRRFSPVWNLICIQNNMVPSPCQGKNFMVAEEENDFSREGGRND